MKTVTDYKRYIAIVLLVVIFVIAALLLLREWEKKQNEFPVLSTEKKTVTYKGSEYELNDNIETFLVLGIDKMKDDVTAPSHSGGTVQADFLMLFVFDNANKKTTAIQINRDTIANINRLDITGNKIGEVEKKQIALAYNYAYGDSGIINCRNTADSVSDLLLGIRVNHYLSLTMDSVTELNDLLGGVEVTVLDDFTGIDDTLVKGETVTLLGDHALQYVRTRKGLENSTNTNRMERQRQYINAAFDKAIDRMKSDAEFTITVVDKMKPYVDYDSTEYRIKEFAEKFDSYEFAGIREIEGQSRPGEEFMEFYPDENSIWETVIDLFYSAKKKDV